MSRMTRLDALEASLVNMKLEYDVLVDEVQELTAQENTIHSKQQDAVYRRNQLSSAISNLTHVISDMKKAGEAGQA